MKSIATTLALSVLLAIGAQAQSPIQLSGHVHCLNGFPMGDVVIRLQAPDGASYEAVTDLEGYWEVKLPEPGTYTLSAEGGPAPAELIVVSTFDVVLMKMHILQIQPLDPIQLLAADINHSGTVTVLDAILMIQYILDPVNNDLGTEWRYTADPQGMLTGSVLDVQGDMGQLDLIGYRTGDLNASACPQ